MPKHHKVTTHPISFSVSFLTAALSLLPLEQTTSNVFKITSAFALLVGIYDLYKENRLKKAFNPILNYFSDLWAKPTNQSPQADDDLTMASLPVTRANF